MAERTSKELMARIRQLAARDEPFNQVMFQMLKRFNATQFECVPDAVGLLALRVLVAQEDIVILRGQLASLKVELLAKEEKHGNGTDAEDN